jgi:acid-sensing ion channel, other
MIACDEVLNEVITDDGICYTFNMMEKMFTTDKKYERSSWNLKSGYENEKVDKPFRAFSGTETGFNIVLISRTSDLDFLCKGPVQGYKLKFHSPNEFPRMSTGFQRIAIKSETLVSVKPTVSFNPDQAGLSCHSTATKRLELFAEYSHANCMNECLSQKVLSQCGCVKFSMVHDDKTSICNQHETTCVSDAVREFYTAKRSENKFPCDCLPNCENLSYNTKISQDKYDYVKTFLAHQEDLEEFPDAAMSRLVVYVEDDYYIPTVYTAQHSVIDMVANLGGFLAFFLGASCISFIEIIFYLTRRVVS